MTDLERVKKLLGRHKAAWGSTPYTDALDDIDAHLKEDAERNRFYSDRLNVQGAELADVQEVVAENVATLEAELAELRESITVQRVGVLYGEIDRLRAELAKARETVKRYVDFYEGAED